MLKLEISGNAISNIVESESNEIVGYLSFEEQSVLVNWIATRIDRKEHCLYLNMSSFLSDLTKVNSEWVAFNTVDRVPDPEQEQVSTDDVSISGGQQTISEYEDVCIKTREFLEIIESGKIDKLLDVCNGDYDLALLKPEDIKLVSLIPMIIRIKSMMA